MIVLDDTWVVKDDKEVDPERVVVEQVDDLVGIDFVEVIVLETDTRTELKALALLISKVAVRVVAVEADGVALEDSHGLAWPTSRLFEDGAVWGIQKSCSAIN